ncbi:hypothetical protein ABZ454_38535 [Streptomyces sp. NPDC005803]|uniref:hypothetical protein n=1 Tax=Streptomyces sp. NPDC005803 TaxID=3154297 RepID=UPI0033F87D32
MAIADAGLTNGAFYGHFASKEDLVAHTIADQFDKQQEEVDSMPFDRRGGEEFIRTTCRPAIATTPLTAARPLRCSVR